MRLCTELHEAARVRVGDHSLLAIVIGRTETVLFNAAYLAVPNDGRPALAILDDRGRVLELGPRPDARQLVEGCRRGPARWRGSRLLHPGLRSYVRRRRVRGPSPCGIGRCPSGLRFRRIAGRRKRARPGHCRALRVQHPHLPAEGAERKVALI